MFWSLLKVILFFAVIGLLALGVLLIAAQSSAITPFIYALF